MSLASIVTKILKSGMREVSIVVRHLGEVVSCFMLSNAVWWAVVHVGKCLLHSFLVRVSRMAVWLARAGRKVAR